MKQLTCEMCGSTDLMKQDGVFVCQSCGTKYSVEEAKKMMVEGTVDVTGSTVKVDTSTELANLYQLARRARDDNNSEDAEKYYGMILVKDPTSWEASFYTIYFRAESCTIAKIQSAARALENCESSVLELIRAHVPSIEQTAAAEEVVQKSIAIAEMLAHGAIRHFATIDASIRHKYMRECIDNVRAARDIVYTCGTAIEDIFDERGDIAPLAAEAWKSGIEIQKLIAPLAEAENDMSDRTITSLFLIKLERYDPQYVREFREEDLQKKIRDQEERIKKIPIEGEWLGVPLAFGILLIILALTLFVVDGRESGIVMLGLGMLLLSAVMFKLAMPDKKALETNKEIVKKEQELLKLYKTELSRIKGDLDSSEDDQ